MEFFLNLLKLDCENLLYSCSALCRVPAGSRYDFRRLEWRVVFLCLIVVEWDSRCGFCKS
jgi:hypothetical protein